MSSKNNSLFLSRYLLIIVLAGLLIFYHSAWLIEWLGSQQNRQPATFYSIQAVLRAAIAFSLLAVVLRLRVGLWAMWLSISGLIVTQYWAHYSGLSFEFVEGRHALSYLRGFIFPTIITLAFPKRLPT